MYSSEYPSYSWTVLFHDFQHHFHLQIYLGKTTPTVINSTGPRLVILFKAGSKPGSGFKANYYFETGIRDILWSYFVDMKYKCGSEDFHIFLLEAISVVVEFKLISFLLFISLKFPFSIKFDLFNILQFFHLVKTTEICLVPNLNDISCVAL